MKDHASNALVAGLGSPYGDDAVGWRVVEGLKRASPPSLRLEACAEPTKLLTLFEAIDRVWIIDACRSKQAVGEISRFQWPDERIDRHWTLAGHGVGLPEVLELATALGSIPRATIVYTINIGRAPHVSDAGLSREVAAAAKTLQARLFEEVMSASGRTPADSAPIDPRPDF